MSCSLIFTYVLRTPGRLHLSLRQIENAEGRTIEYPATNEAARFLANLEPKSTGLYSSPSDIVTGKYGQKPLHIDRIDYF